MSDAFLPERLDLVTPDVVRRVADLGFAGVFTRFTDEDPHQLTEHRCRAVRDVFEAEGVAMFQATGYRPPLVHHDEAVRGEAVRTLRRALEVAGWLGSESIDTGPGSVSPEGPWAPDPYNFSDQAAEQLVRSLREAADAAEEHGVVLCLEGHQLVTTRSAQITRDVLDAVGSDWVKADFDPANWITLETIYDSGPAIEQMAAVLHDHIWSTHVKDVVLRSSMMVHIDHCPGGQGMLDIATQLRVVGEISPDAPVIVEATPAGDLPAVAALLTDLSAP
jgi:sugar phosphate isomerase/epimerase